MIRYTLAGLLGAVIWAALSLSGISLAGILAGPGWVSAGLIASVLAALAGCALASWALPERTNGARVPGQADARATATAPEKQAAQTETPPTRVAQSAKAAGPARSDAITLLATLQREARFVDLVQESLSEYSDAQVGAAARDVLRDCRAVIERFFDLQPVVDQPEGTPVEIPAGKAAGRYRLIGTDQAAVSGRGAVVHHGWEAKKCQLPQWSGSKELSLIVAPAELEAS